ncbi:MAG: GIY-YIG nuclease family protein [Kiritimatiellia bacterium]
MNVCVYILYSPTLGKYYVGLSSNPGQRCRQHCRGQSFWTSRATDWQEVFREACGTTKAARELERTIKATGAQRYMARIAASQSRPEAGQG